MAVWKAEHHDTTIKHKVVNIVWPKLQKSYASILCVSLPAPIEHNTPDTNLPEYL